MIPANVALPIIVVGPEHEHELTDIQRQVIADSLSITNEDVPDFDQGTRLFEGRYGGAQLIATFLHSGIYTFRFLISDDAPGALKPIDPNKPVKFFGTVCPGAGLCDDLRFQDITDYFFFGNLELTDGLGDTPLGMSLGVSVPSGGSLDVIMAAYYVDDTPQ